MKKKLLALFTAIALCGFAGMAKTVFPDSETASNEVELGVEAIQRICPTGMWDRWTFRDIMYDRGSNTVMLVIQLNSWNGSSGEITEHSVKKEAESILGNIMEGYRDLVAHPRTECDGDFMLYLSLGTLLRTMEANGATLQIALLKPDYENLVVRDMPMSLTPAELKPFVE